jgi:hypothetical protein
MAVPYTFGTATASIPLSNLDSNFATTITLGNTAIQLGNTVTTLNNMTLANATVSSLSTPITPAQGGTGLATLTANNVMLGNGTSNVAFVAPGTSGNVLASNGTTWVSQAAASTTSISNGTSNVSIATSGGAVTVATNGNTAVTVTTSQQVGIGTTSPSVKFQVSHSSDVAAISASGGGVTLGLSNSSANDVLQRMTNNSSNFWDIRNVSSSSNFVVGYNGNDRMTFDTSGNVSVGGTTSYGKITSAASSGYCFGTDSVSNGADHFRFTTGGGTTTGSITRVGGTGVAYNVTSDQRLKENIQDAGSASALVAALQVRQFDWKVDNSHQNFGFVAQELLTIAPEAVHQPSDETEMMGVDYSKLVPMLTKAIQEQQALITSLTARIAALEAK